MAAEATVNPLPALDAGTVLGFGFGQPLVLVALLIPVLLVLAVRHARGRRARARALLGGPPGLRDGADERVRLALAALVVLAALLAVVAGARPQWGEGDREIAQRGIDVVVALDVSRSMAAEDVAPSRARAASDGLEEMLTHLTGNRVGLVTFAGSAFERSPLTVDLGVLSSLIARSQSEAPLVRPGTNLAGAIEAGLHVLNVDDAAGAQAILLVSDGEDLDPAFERAVALAQDRGVRIYTVFAGTANPTALPSTSGGNDVSTAQPEVLAAIAEATGGTVRAVDRIPGFAVDFRRLQQTQFDSATERQPIERFTWFAGAALALLLVAMVAGERGRGRLPRLRGGAITALVAAAILAGCGTAAWRHAETGNEAYQAGAYEDALAAYRQAADAAP
ncbi:MAG: VWA domain-containing protein, partial [Dehalococcoidia bacterium]